MRASRAIAALVVLSLLAPSTVGGVTQADGPCVGTVAAPADGTTVVSVQGAKLNPSEKRDARLVGVGPQGNVEWVFDATEELDAVWSYDVDPLDDGNLFVTATRSGTTLFFELDPVEREVVWTDEVDLVDTHDADLLDEHRILIANMRNYDDETGENDDRLLIYNRTSGEVEWEWLFREHGFDPAGGGNYSDDWTHVNDVDRVAEGEYLASPRNFDQVILVNRSTGEVDLRLGEDDETSVLNQQHNPQYLETESGDPAFLVADSENDRIVEYEHRNGEWERTWTVGTSERLAWPRDADRLPNGNTLVADSRNHRVIEVSPEGGVVWEFYSPWLVYDVTRVEHGDEPGGPAMSDLGATGTHDLAGAEPRPVDDVEGCATALSAAADRWHESGPVSTGTTDESTGTDGRHDTDADGTAGTPGGTVTVADETASSPGQAGFTAFAAIAAVALALLARQRS